MLRFWKLMFLNNYNNYIIFKSIKLTNNNYIYLYFLIFHLIYCMQLLNVEIFQSYKYWHNVSIQKAFAKFNIEYLFARFCRNFIKIRNNIFKSKIIRNVFKKSEMWSINAKRYVNQLKKFKIFNNVKTIRMMRKK